MTAYRATSGPAIAREELVEALARTSHDTWIRQARRDGKPTWPELTAHDRERAEDAVRALEAIGVLHPCCRPVSSVARC